MKAPLSPPPRLAPSARAGTFRPLRPVPVLLEDLDAVIGEFAVGLPALPHLAQTERRRRIIEYLERLSALLDQDLPHSSPPELHPSLRNN